eukprot:3892172-Rhodomonas_salina.1
MIRVSGTGMETLSWRMSGMESEAVLRNSLRMCHISPRCGCSIPSCPPAPITVMIPTPKSLRYTIAGPILVFLVHWHLLVELAAFKSRSEAARSWLLVVTLQLGVVTSQRSLASSSWVWDGVSRTLFLPLSSGSPRSV